METSVRAVATHVAVAVDEKAGLIGTAPVRFSFHAKHIFFDGLGLRQFISDIFCLLGKELSGGASLVAPSCRAVPPPPVLLDSLAADQTISGPSFEARRATYIKALLEGKRNWGLQPNITSQDDKPQSIRHTLSADQSKANIANLKTTLWAEYSIIHLAHVAVFATVLELHPPGPDEPDSQAHLPASPVNSRRFLTAEFATGRKSFDTKNSSDKNLCYC
ncbi:uncharacterized protein LDX57_001942 [Aspergillus melleus]|uniref:uncharacterized protein n=1 Tax=Aspergillus melleus TaxID=138277 RepID=UPI001E8DAAF5|nr:uncharacterized protein LDX57_001942 [Aspergillus melleus]KAH8424187.1 hypothetical protein LDX57_001942 [Aspergillus melleus]